MAPFSFYGMVAFRLVNRIVIYNIDNAVCAVFALLVVFTCKRALAKKNSV